MAYARRLGPFRREGVPCAGKAAERVRLEDDRSGLTIFVPRSAQLISDPGFQSVSYRREGEAAWDAVVLVLLRLAHAGARFKIAWRADPGRPAGGRSDAALSRGGVALDTRVC